MGSSNRFRAIVHSCCVLVLFSCTPLVAEERRSLTLSQGAPRLDTVDRAFFILSDAQRIIGVAPATYIDSPEKPSTPEGEKHGGIIVGRVPMPETNLPLKVLAVIVGSKGEIWSHYREVRLEELPATASLPTTELRDRFVERRGIFRALQITVAAEEEKLSELQEDADAIANVAKIVGAEDELGELKVSIGRVAAAQSTIQDRMRQMKTRPSPPNAQAREAELGRQLGDLSKALALTESNALKKISTATSDLRQKLRLIEDTRDEHIDLLEQELADLKRKRRHDGQKP